MKSEQIELLLRRSKEREARFRGLNAPQTMFDAEKQIQRKLYRKKVIGYRKVFSKIIEGLRCLLL